MSDTMKREGGPSTADGRNDGSVWTVLEVLRWTTGHFERAGLPTARLDAEVLLAHALGCDRVRLYMDYERPLNPDERAAYRQLVKRRASGEPAAYLLGEKEFYGRPFKADRRVLVPRPETEHVVDAAIEALRSGDLPEGEAPPLLLDLCTGSGCIAATLAAEIADAIVVAVDLDEEACDVARENAQALGVEDRVMVLEGDLFEPVVEADLGPFSLIVSNPPYISTSEMDDLMRDVREHEPRAALESGPTGLEILERIIEEAPLYASPGAHLILEHAENQGEHLLDILRSDQRYVDARDVRDHAGLDRVVLARLRD